jgi:hypothetical protein
MHGFMLVTDKAEWCEVHEMSDIVFEQVKELATRLSLAEKARLIEWLEATLSEEGAAPAPPTPSRSLYGLCADLGPGPTDEDIEEVRQLMWSNFPRYAGHQ